MKHRKLGADLTVSAIGLGCMGMTYAYGGQEEAKSIETLRRAVDLGVTFFDTAEVYGPLDNEILLGKALKGLRDKVVIATKFGFTFDKPRRPFADHRRRQPARACEGSRRRLAEAVGHRSRSISTTSIASTPRCRSRRRSGPWPSWSRPER